MQDLDQNLDVAWTYLFVKHKRIKVVGDTLLSQIANLFNKQRG
jgi:hypothetical protein